MNTLPVILLAAATLLSGCTEFMEGYNDAKAHRGEPGYSLSERLARVGDALANDAGRFATGYANAYDEYQATHPVVYVQPQHGVMTGYANGQPVWINY